MMNSEFFFELVSNIKNLAAGQLYKTIIFSPT